MMASVPVIRLENVGRTFDDGTVVALCDVSLSMYANDCVAILGKSGSGKSTLIHILSGSPLCLPGFADRPAEGLRIRCHCHYLGNAYTRISVTTGGIPVKKSR